MQRNAILCGSAPLGFTQKKLNEMHGFLISSAGGAWQEKEITIFPNGVSEAMLLFVLGQLKSQKIDYILLYIYALKQVLQTVKKAFGLAAKRFTRKYF